MSYTSKEVAPFNLPPNFQECDAGCREAHILLGGPSDSRCPLPSIVSLFTGLSILFADPHTLFVLSLVLAAHSRSESQQNSRFRYCYLNSHYGFFDAYASRRSYPCRRWCYPP